MPWRSALRSSPFSRRRLVPAALAAIGLTLVAVRPAAAQRVSGSVATVSWTVRTLPHVDLWLHAFALLSNDSAQAPTVPLYRRGYRDSLDVVRRRAQVISALDGNQARLVDGLGRAGGYRSAQFVPFAYPSWEALQRSADLFISRQGDLRRAPLREAQPLQPLATVFRTAADREWLRLFVASVADEEARWYGAEVTRVTASRQAVLAEVERLWAQERPQFARFLANSGLRVGELVLSLPIGAEGRMMTREPDGSGATRTVVAVPFPARVDDAAQALYVLAHELTGPLVTPVVTNHVTPAEGRSGTAARITSLAQVVTGALLLGRIAPALRPGYQAFYLAQVGVAVPTGADVSVWFERTFPLPATVRDALIAQLDLILGGL